MKIGVKMPQEGMAMTSGDIVEWNVAIGDKVEKGQELAQVEAGKSSFGLTSPCSGTVTEFCVEEGDTVMVGDIVLKLQA